MRQVHPPLFSALEEGLANAWGGEIVVRGARATGRIFLFRGRIAWVTCSSVPKHLRDVLVARCSLKTEDVDAAFADAQRNRGNFGETLVRWGLVDETQLRDALLAHNAHHFRAIVEVAAADAAQALFIAQDRQYAGTLLFTLEEVQAAALLSPTAAHVASDDMLCRLRALEAADGFLGAALVDLNENQVVAAFDPNFIKVASAVAGDAEVVKAKQKTIQSLKLDDVLEDIVISMSSEYHLLRLSRRQPHLLFFLSLNRSRANLAMARYQLSHVEGDTHL